MSVLAVGIDALINAVVRRPPKVVSVKLYRITAWTVLMSLTTDI